jgi:hypothetical protein
MNTTLYLLRQSIEHVNQAVFLPSETEGDVVLLEEGGSSVLSHSKGKVFSLAENSRHSFLSYDDLIDKIFQVDHVIVV